MIHYDNLASSIQNYTPNMHTYVYIHISMYRKDVYGIILLEVVFQEFGELGIRDEAIWTLWAKPNVKVQLDRSHQMWPQQEVYKAEKTTHDHLCFTSCWSGLGKLISWDMCENQKTKKQKAVKTPWNGRENSWTFTLHSFWCVSIYWDVFEHSCCGFCVVLFWLRYLAQPFHIMCHFKSRCSPWWCASHPPIHQWASMCFAVLHRLPLLLDGIKKTQ